jgi:hypothetical protein
MGETDINTIFAQDPKEMPVKLYRSPRFAIALLFANGIDPHILGHLNPPPSHRDDMDELYPSRQRLNPNGRKAQDGIIGVSDQIEKE